MQSRPLVMTQPVCRQQAPNGGHVVVAQVVPSPWKAPPAGRQKASGPSKQLRSAKQQAPQGQLVPSPE
jgi:hypothetical protein